MPRPRNASIRDFPGKRWLNVGLRAVHVVGLILLGAGLLSQASEMGLAITLTVSSGLAMFLIDTWANPAQLREVAGFGVLIKLALIGLMAAQPAIALTIFWFLVLLSTLLSHAPASFRHKQLF